ncbi:MAG TPA: ATP-binding protein [Jatrophihabitans sp.]|nr:ATP-binding protein [Jatrophihabitans sp.]
MSLPFHIDNPDAAEQPPARSGGLARVRALAHRFSPRTLTGRLMLGVVALVTVLVLLVGIATYTLLAPFLIARVDEQLTSVTQPSNIGRYIEYAQHPDTTLPGAQNIWFVALQSNGLAVLTVPDDLLLHPLNLNAADRGTLAQHPNSYRTVTTTDGTELRVLPAAVTFSVNGQRVPGVAVVGLSMHDVDGTLRRLVRLEILLGLGAIVLAAGVTAWGVRAGLRPLHRVTRTAQEVTAELGPDGSGLDRRVPVEGAAIEVEQVASSVNTLLQAVETQFSARVASEERMRQFLADASHELRTPLTSIRGYAELSRLQAASGQAADDAMRRIEIEGTRMSRLVEDLLVLARGDQDSALQVGEVPVDLLMSEAATAVHAAHPGRSIEVGGGAEGLTVVGDWDQLLRVLINLATNAAVHTPDGPIRLSAAPSTLPAAVAAVALQVGDTGPGLPPEEAAHVFERFWRADKARSRARGGSGLGMAIVAQIVAAHGGSVHFDSSVERGTTVTVVLPVAGPAQRGPQPEDAHGWPAGQPWAEPDRHGEPADQSYLAPPEPSRRPAGPLPTLPPGAPAPPSVPSGRGRPAD